AKTSEQGVIASRQYAEFRREIMSAPLNMYEKFCNASEGILKLKPDAKKAELLEESIKISHLNITPTGAYSFTILSTFIILFIGAVLGLVILKSGFIMLVFLLTAGMVLVIADKFPAYLANNWRLKASNQMVICIFYVATYMRHTSNLEKAIEFASEHVLPPLSLDLKKVLWDVETERYGSVKESLDNYLESWRKWNLEFIESFHLIEASLYEPSEARRLSFIDKALEVILQETYERMLHYAHNLKNPITMLHMLGIILPILGLVILPLMVSFMESVRWYHIALVYNFILPLAVYYLGKNILSQRPTGYGESDITETNPNLKKLKNIIIKIGQKEIVINPIFIALLIAAVPLFIGIFPLLIHWISPSFDIQFGNFILLDYMPSKINPGRIIGPFGLGAAMFSLFIPLGIGMGVASYYLMRSKNIIKIREDAKALENEFASGLFQLGNRIGDGLPIEIAFDRVGKVMQGTKSGDFFTLVSNNITKLGMGMKSAIFDKSRGALVYFPSRIIASSMEVLLQSAQKGPLVCSQALMNVSQYIKEIHRVNERLRDLLADIISSMKSQIKFLAPAIAGIVVGITAMISTILKSLSKEMGKISTDVASASVSGIPDMFGDGIPPYYFQIVVGLYVIQIVYVLTILANGVENGSDKLNEIAMIGRNIRSSIILYTIIAGSITIVFNIVAMSIMGAIG
ncbi:hypothetical protein KY320_01295, partial [Candidatus Woesearchaeota archaeon]|nr:hypothetical protein [Candidatus Woesearchaeota archaeon]